MQDEEKDLFEVLGWEAEIVRVADPQVPFNPLSEREVSAAKQYRDDYEMTSFLQSTQAWKWREEEEQQQYVEQVRMRVDRVQQQVDALVQCEVDDVIDLSVDIAWTPIKMDGKEESNDEDREVEGVLEPPRTLSFCEKMKRLSPHCLLLKERIQRISYVDLLFPGPLSPKSNDDSVPQGCRRLALQKHISLPFSLITLQN